MADKCEVHRYHSPKPMRFVTHHILPLEMGGTDVPENRIGVCDTGHYNIHRLLGHLSGERAKEFSHGGAMDKYYAKLGYDKWVELGKPGHPVFELVWQQT